VVRPVDADVVDLVLAVAQLDNAVDDPARVGAKCRLGRLVRCRPADDRARPLCVVCRDLSVLLAAAGVNWVVTRWLVMSCRVTELRLDQ
jgi:hypothetical protein